MVKGEKPQKLPVQVSSEPQSATEQLVIFSELALTEPNVRPTASPLDDLDNVPPGGLSDEDIGDGEAQPRVRKPRARPIPSPDFTPPQNVQVVKGDDLNGLLLVMLLEMQMYWGGTIRSEVAMYLAQQLSKRSGDRFHGMNTISMAAKVREFVEKKKWLAAQTRGYVLTPRGVAVVELYRRRSARRQTREETCRAEK